MACETACPSGVEYGQIIELARARLQETGSGSKSLEGFLGRTTNPRLVSLQLFAAEMIGLKKPPKFVMGDLTTEPQQATLPKRQRLEPKWSQATLPAPTKGKVAILNGCVMNVLYRRVHQATLNLIRRVGYEPIEIGSSHCCGALHLHSGLPGEARRRATDLVEQIPPGIPLLTHSAGCGSTIKDFEGLLGTEAAKSVAGRTLDISQFLIQSGLIELLESSRGVPEIATYHDACHLAHGQRVTNEPRQLLDAIPQLRVVPLPQADHCCGSAGIYNLRKPTTARRLLDEKYAAIESTGATLAILGNPGCHAWIEQAAREQGNKVRILHLAEMLEASFNGLPSR